MQLILNNYLLNGAGLGRLGIGRMWQDGEQGVRAGTHRQSLRSWGCLSLRKDGEALSEVG